VERILSLANHRQLDCETLLDIFVIFEREETREGLTREPLCRQGKEDSGARAGEDGISRG
jgi:hypothetical protein